MHDSTPPPVVKAGSKLGDALLSVIKNNLAITEYHLADLNASERVNDKAKLIEKKITADTKAALEEQGLTFATLAAEGHTYFAVEQSSPDDDPAENQILFIDPAIRLLKPNYADKYFEADPKVDEMGEMAFRIEGNKANGRNILFAANDLNEIIFTGNAKALCTLIGLETTPADTWVDRTSPSTPTPLQQAFLSPKIEFHHPEVNIGAQLDPTELEMLEDL